MLAFTDITEKLRTFITKHGRLLRFGFYALLFAAVNVWLIFSIVHKFHTAIPLLVFDCIAWISLAYLLLEFYVPKSVVADFGAALDKLARSKLRIVFGLVVGAALFGYVLYLCIKNTVQLVSLASLAILLIVSVLCSAYPARIKWTPVLWGLFLQYAAVFLVLKWPTGSTAFRWATEQFVRFLGYTSNGTTFVFGFVPQPPNICGMEGPFSFTSLPIIIFFGSLCSAFYYLGIVQWFLIKVAAFLHYTMETTAAESLNAAASIFLGPTEAAVMMRNSLGSMTESEMLATMTAGFSMISGSLFALYIAFGACPVHLLAANIMSAPAVLAVSKIVYPEVQKSKQKEMKSFKFPPCTESSLLESISSGAVQAVTVIFAIIVNLIVFLALVALLDNAIGFLASTIGYNDVTFNKLLGWAFFPVAYIMGVSDAEDATRKFDETMKVAQLIGTKTILNEFIAYQQMSDMLNQGQLGKRAQMMAVFACCGYSNISQIGCQLGIFGSMAPGRNKSVSRLALRSLLAGSIACLMTAAVVGTMVKGGEQCLPSTASSNCVQMG